ncbi:MAG TPA: hypothetical protein VMN36_08390 [Verrucomicrobiales bacterium]|nr:hypothetical protein [Verrucomicrobiales bacterium]
MSASNASGGGFQPWLGLLPYSEDDQELFFGRESDTQDLLRLVRREVVTVLFGRSGTGKSSLLKAGLFPKLRQEQMLPIWIRLDHSGKTSYGRQVPTEIKQAVASREIEVEILNEALADETDDVWEYLHRVEFWDARNQPVTPVLVFDQFEELFTLGRNRPEIAAFVEELAAVAENLIPRRIRDRVISGNIKLPAAYNERHYKLIISLREDYVSRLDSLSKDMPSVMHNRHSLTHMSGEQALEVVMKPGGDLVSEEVARKIVRFVAAANDAEAVVDPGGASVDLQHLRTEPALLSLVCSELNLQRIKEGRKAITLEQVQRSSDQILEDFYERSLKGLDPEDRRFIEDRLVTASGFRTTVPVEEAVQADLTDDEIEQLVMRRLLRKEDRLGTPHVELTHDVLTRVVTRSRSLRQQREEVEARHREEEKQKAERRKLKERDDIEIARLRRMRNIMRAIWVVIGLSTALATVAVILLFSRSEVQKARKLENAQALALKGIGVGSKDPELALLLSIESAMGEFYGKDSGMGTREIELALRTATRESLIRRRYEGHTSKVYSADFDREGRRLATGSWFPDSTARIWDVDGGKEIARFDHGALPGGKTTVSCARFSPDGRRLVTTTYRDNGSVYIWNAEPFQGTGAGGPRVFTQPLATFTGHKAWVTSAAFRPDGKLVATGGHDNRVRLWDPETGIETTRPLGGGPVQHTKRIRSVGFNTEGTRLLSTSDDGTAILWNLADPTEQPKVFDAFSGSAENRETLHDGDLSPSGNLIATAGNDKTVRIWDAVTGSQLASQMHPDGVMDVSFIDDSHVVTVCNDSAIRFWVLESAADDPIRSHHPDAASVKVLRLSDTQRGHQGWIRNTAVSPDRRFIATAGDDGTARLWKLPPGGEIAVLGKPDFNCWSADTYLSKIDGKDKLIAYAGAENGGVRAVDAFTERMLEDWGPMAGDTIRHTGDVRALSVSPDGKRLVTASSDQTAIVWDALTGRPLFQITGHQGPGGGTIYQARFSADGKRIITASNEGGARVWNAENGAPELMLIQDRQEITNSHFDDFDGLRESLRPPTTPAAEFLLSRCNDDERARIIQPSTAGGGSRNAVRDLLNRVIRENSLKDEAAFSDIVMRPMTLELTKRELGDNDRKILNLLILEDTFPAGFTKDRVYDARFSSDGTRIVTADFNARTATLWDSRDGRKLRELRADMDPKLGHSDHVLSASFSPDGKQVVTASTDGFCRIWDASAGALMATIPHGISIRSAEYSPDGKLILTASADGAARLWTLPGHHLRAELRGHTGTLTDARFSKDGTYIVTASRDGTARIYQTHPWWVYSLATQRVTRKLTLEERDRFGVTRKLTDAERDYYLHEKSRAKK